MNFTWHSVLTFSHTCPQQRIKFKLDYLIAIDYEYFMIKGVMLIWSPATFNIISHCIQQPHPQRAQHVSWLGTTICLPELATITQIVEWFSVVSPNRVEHQTRNPYIDKLHAFTIRCNCYINYVHKQLWYSQNTVKIMKITLTKVCSHNALITNTRCHGRGKILLFTFFHHTL